MVFAILVRPNNSRGLAEDCRSQALSTPSPMHLTRASRAFRHHVSRRQTVQTVSRHRYSTENASGKPKSAHAEFYSGMLPDMVPIAILGSAVYLVRSKPTLHSRSTLLIISEPVYRASAYSKPIYPMSDT